MKKTMRVVLLQILIVAFLATTVDFSMLAPRNVQAISLPTGMASAKKTTSTMKIDGLLNEKSWSIKTPIEIEAVAFSNNKAYFGILWDAKYVYVGVKVYDANVFNSAADFTTGDSVQVFFDMNDNHFIHYDLFDSFFKVGVGSAKIWEKYNKTTGVRHASKRTSYGYCVEMAFPVSTLLVEKMKAGRMFGLDVGVADDDDGGGVSSQLLWYGTKDNDIFTQNFGDFYLNDAKNTLKPPKHPKEYQPSVYHFKNFYEYVYPSDPTRIVRLWIPSVTAPVKGLIIIGNGGNGDWRYESAHRELQVFARKYGFGVVSHAGIIGSRTYEENGRIILNAFKLFAKIGKNPELANVPFIYSGSSSGGASAYGMMNFAPSRTIAITSNVTAGFNPATPSDAALKVPAMFTTGEFDGSFQGMKAMVRGARARGALWSWLGVQGMAHEHRRTYHMFLPFWAKCITMRMPANANPKSGPVKLNEIKEDTGWLTDDTTWASGYTTIAPYADYMGVKADAGWIIDKDIAYLYRGLSTWSQRLNITMDNNPAPFSDVEYTLKVLKPGSELVLRIVPVNFPGTLTKVAFYMGGKLLGETTGTSFETNLSNQYAAQTFTAVGYDENGKPYASSILGVIMDVNKA
ncbi:MAG: sugar-binding protein [Clostridia bacterium]